MGRGRQKAKQMKVARRLKYFSPTTDLDALQRELGGDVDDFDSIDPEGDGEDEYAEWASEDEEED